MTTTMTRALLLLLTILALDCKDKGTEPTPERVRLTLIDTAVREAYLHIAVAAPSHNETLALQRNGTTVMTFAAVADTNIADTALTQTTTYLYTATVQTHETTGKSNTIAAQTLAPTSHNFTWQTFLLGDGNGSALYDVALINDTLAYAVGEIYLSGDPRPYNLAKWDGLQWELKRVSYIFRGNLVTVPMRGISAFSATDIWLASGDAVHGDGSNWIGYDIRTIVGNQGLAFYRCWGLNTSNMYFVGPLGSIAYFNGTTWLQLESGTTTQINDAWGVVNPVTGKEEVYCPTGSFFTPGDRRVLKISDGMRVDSLASPLRRLLDAAWTGSGIPLYVAGDGVFLRVGGSWSAVDIGASIYTNDIRGNTLNDIFVAGDFGMIGHFNGENWQLFFEDMNRSYYTIATKEDVVVIVGEVSSRGLVTIGRR
ncbi:hypothetical protein FBQ87_09570 [Sphingobacteriales bacterium CHB3]|nr:hypothetical protein [Sphingobacteriales bacterium CHB3]